MAKAVRREVGTERNGETKSEKGRIGWVEIAPASRAIQEIEGMSEIRSLQFCREDYQK